MKKKTTITTEKHEVWVVRQSPGEEKGEEIDVSESQSVPDSVIALIDEVSTSEEFPEEES